MVDFDGDRLLDLAGAVILVLLLFALATVLLAGMAGPQRPEEVPDAEWELTRVNGSYVRITHAGGDPVRAAKLSVTVDGTPRHPDWTARSLVEGESGVVRADAGSEVLLLWRPSEVERAERAVLARW